MSQHNDRGYRLCRLVIWVAGGVFQDVGVWNNESNGYSISLYKGYSLVLFTFILHNQLSHSHFGPKTRSVPAVLVLTIVLKRMILDNHHCTTMQLPQPRTLLGVCQRTECPDCFICAEITHLQTALEMCVKQRSFGVFGSPYSAWLHSNGKYKRIARRVLVDERQTRLWFPPFPLSYRSAVEVMGR